MSRDELQRRSLEAALGDVRVARVEFDDVAGWVASAGASPEDPLGAEVWVISTPGQPQPASAPTIPTSQRP
jgi:8-oxo-dGTP diphosphatase